METATAEQKALKIVREPKVYLVGRQVTDEATLARFLADEQVTWQTDSEVGAEKLAEIAGRVCYMSYGKGRKTNKEFIGHIIEVGHGSVLEHGVWSFLVTGVSRSFTHELIRHRHFSYSQLSQRYVDESDSDYIEPDVIAGDPELHRVWSEAVPWDTLRSPRVLGLLRRYGLDVLVAVRPGDEGDLPELLGACRDAGVGVALWPMLSDAEGRWASARNTPAFVSFVRRLRDGLGRDRALLAPEIAVDLEPPITDVRALLGERGTARGLLAALRTLRTGMDDVTPAYVELCRELHADGVRATAAVVPLALAGGASPRLTGTPTHGSTWDHVTVMLYSSILEGWSHGWLGREDARAILARGARQAARRFGERAGVSLGAVGVGAFGNEPVYRAVSELADDVAIARASGVDDLTLFDLGGVLAREPAEAWLEAFVATPAAPDPVPATPRARVALFLVALGGGLGLAGAAPLD